MSDLSDGFAAKAMPNGGYLVTGLVGDGGDAEVFGAFTCADDMLDWMSREFPSARCDGGDPGWFSLVGAAEPAPGSDVSSLDDLLCSGAGGKGRFVHVGWAPDPSDEIEDDGFETVTGLSDGDNFRVIGEVDD